MDGIGGCFVFGFGLVHFACFGFLKFWLVCFISVLKLMSCLLASSFLRRSDEWLRLGFQSIDFLKAELVESTSD